MSNNSINIEKANSSKKFDVFTGNKHNEVNQEFNVKHREDDFDFMEQPKESNLGLDFLTPDGDAEIEEEQIEGSDDDDVLNNEYDAQEQSHGIEDELSFEDIKQRKSFALYNLNRYRKQGYEWSRNFGTNHSLEELETELSRIETEKTLDNGLESAKTLLSMAVHGIETVNTRYGKDYIKLHGWAAYVREEYKSHKYDDCLVKLYQKYSSNLPSSPEFTLIFLLGASAYTFHMSRLQAESDFNRNSRNNSNIDNYSGSVPVMKQPSTNYEDLMNEMDNLSDNSDINSVVSGISGVSELSGMSGASVSSGINITLPGENKPKKKGRGRPRKEL
jgi:hypothetical protein